MNDHHKIEFFWSGGLSNFDAEDICRQLNGEFPLLPETREESILLKKSIKEYFTWANTTFAPRPWVGGTIRRENQTRDFYPPSVL